MTDVALRGKSTEYPLISVVFIGYRRPELLTDTVHSLLATTRYPNLELILSDDGSPRAMQEAMRQLPFDRFLFAPRNQGLGRNTNDGLKAAKGEFILQVQDDWRCVGPSDFLETAIAAFDELPQVGLIRFHRPPTPLAHEVIDLQCGKRALVFDAGLYPTSGQYAYTDRPHVKRRTFHSMLGYYLEGVPMTTMELEFSHRVDNQRKTRIAFIEPYDAFSHTGEEHSFNPSIRRARIRDDLNAHFTTRALLRGRDWIRHRARRRR